MHAEVHVRLLSRVIFPKNANFIFSWGSLTEGLVFLGPCPLNFTQILAWVFSKSILASKEPYSQ